VDGQRAFEVISAFHGAGAGKKRKQRVGQEGSVRSQHSEDDLALVCLYLTCNPPPPTQDRGAGPETA